MAHYTSCQGVDCQVIIFLTLLASQAGIRGPGCMVWVSPGQSLLLGLGAEGTSRGLGFRDSCRGLNN